MSLSDRLNKRISLYTIGADQDEIGQPIEVPVFVASVCAEVRDKDGDLAVDADAIKRTVKTDILIRARNLPENLTVRYKGNVYRVDAVLGQDNRTLLLTTVKIGAIPA